MTDVLNYRAGEKPAAKPVDTETSYMGWWAVVLITLALAIVPAVLWIGDISWMGDEPRLLAKAYHANQNRTIETRGLNGNFGVPYGPLPTQIYQLLLLISHDPLTIGAIRAGLCAGGTALAMLWLARSLRLNPWFATAVVIAPYVWNFQRIMWDASFAIPIGAVALAAYTAFLRSASGKALLTSIAAALALAFIHPQDLPLMLPIAGHMAWNHRSALGKHYIGIAVIFGIAVALNAGYARHAYYALEWQVKHGVIEKGYPGTTSRAKSLLTPLLGGAILSGYDFAATDSQLVEHPTVVRAAQFGSSVVYPLVWLGIGVAGVRFLRHRRGAIDGERDDPHDPTLAGARRAVFGIALIGLVLLSLLYGLMRMPAFPQYFFGTFILYVMLAWIGIDFLSRIRVGWAAIAIYGVSVAYITIASANHIHRVGYARGTYRPSLAEQVRIAKALNRYSDQTALTDVQLLKSHPQALRALRLLIPPTPGQSQTTSGRLVITHTSGPSGTDSALTLTEATQDADFTNRAAPLDVTPLPPEWQPAK